jgi:hypothetical protein
MTIGPKKGLRLNKKRAVAIVQVRDEALKIERCHKSQDVFWSYITKEGTKSLTSPSPPPFLVGTGCDFGAKHKVTKNLTCTVSFNPQNTPMVHSIISSILEKKKLRLQLV